MIIAGRRILIIVVASVLRLLLWSSSYLLLLMATTAHRRVSLDHLVSVNWRRLGALWRYIAAARVAAAHIIIHVVAVRG